MLLLLANSADLPAGRIFGLDQQTLIGIGIQLFNTSLLAALLAFILYNPVRNFLRKRTERITSQLESAENDIAKANELKAQYDQKLKEIESERGEILESAHKFAADRAFLILDDAKKEANAIKERAAVDIELERERVRNEMKNAIIEVASAMTEKFLTRTMDSDAQERLFAETMVELEETTWLN